MLYACMCLWVNREENLLDADVDDGDDDDDDDVGI